MPLGADRLGGIFDHFQIVPAGDLVDRVHVRALSEEMDRHDGFGVLA